MYNLKSKLSQVLPPKKAKFNLNLAVKTDSW
jgi:hypothetical protein